MTKEEIIDGLEIYTVGRLNKARVHITVEELQKFIDEIKTLEQEPILDKIRAKIEDERSFQRMMEEYDIATGLRKALEIIDKYKSESEDKK